MNKKVTTLLAAAMVVGLVAGSNAMADHHKSGKAKTADEGCKGKEGCKAGKDGCKGKKVKHEKKETGGTTTTTTTTEEAPAKTE